MQNTIIHPTDFSECANKALDYAIFIAKGLNLKISIAHAISFNELDPLMRNSQNIINETESLKKVAEKNLKDLINKIEAHQIRCEAAICSGEISSWLPEFTNKNNPKMIVMGTTGSSNFANKIFGSNTYSIIKDTTVPLLSIPEKAALKGFKKLTFLSDYRDKDISFISFIVELASHFNSAIDIVHILDEESSKKVNNQKLLDNLKLKVEEELNYKNLKYQLLYSNDIEHGIQSLIKESNPDLLALVRRKQNFFERLFFGSLTEKMAHHTNIPLLVFPIED